MARKAKAENWPTKGQAALDLSISERSIERLINAGKIKIGYRRVPGRKPLTVCNPADIEKLKAETLQPVPKQVTPEVMPTKRSTPPPALRHSATLPAVAMTGAIPAIPKIFLTVTEAADLTGLTQSYLRRAIADGTLPAIKDKGWKIKRRDLYKL